MKRLLYSIFCILLMASFFPGCKKESSNDKPGNSTYYIKGKKDGVAFNYSANAAANVIDFSSSAGMISLALVANSQPNATSLEGMNVGINFFNSKKPATGTYSEEDSSPDYAVAGVYNPNSQTIVWGAGIHTPTVKPLKVIILTKTTTEITGTFEGAFYKQDVSIPAFYDDHILFTECEFKLPIK